FLKEGDGERAREALVSLQCVCLFPLYEEECATVPWASQSEDDGLMTDLDKLFEGLLARVGEEAEGQASQRGSQDECRFPIEGIKGSPTGLVRLQLLAYQEHHVFEAPNSHNTADQIPQIGRASCR